MMKNRPHFQLLPVVLLALGTGCSQSDTRSPIGGAAVLPAHPIVASEVPADLPLNGVFVSGMRWEDATGVNMILLSETGPVPGQTKSDAGENTQDAELEAVHVFKAMDRHGVYWTVRDGVRGCPFDVFASFRRGSLQVTDLDNDGIPETWFMYMTMCTSDVSPSNLNLVMHEGHEEYIMKGFSKVDIGGGKMDGGTFSMDYAFMNGPREFLDYAVRLWKQNEVETWGE